MKVSFNLDVIDYLKMDYTKNGRPEALRLALKEKREREFIAVLQTQHPLDIETPQEVTLGFVCPDGLYRTKTILKEIVTEGDLTYFIINNPETLDYQQNREYYRVLADFDCIYTVESKDGVESYNATTYDISAGGISIIMEENIVSTEEMSILIFMPMKNISSHLKFIRCELSGKEYKLSFEFTDIKDSDFKLLSDYCIGQQLQLHTKEEVSE